MATGQVSAFLRRLARGMAAATMADWSDGQLVEALLNGRDHDTVFAVMLRRHGPMVYRVCWRVLQHEQDAEDVLQATFLVLAQRLHTLRKRASLASWLHGVAHRVALKTKTQAAARLRHERRAVPPRRLPPDEVTWKELRTVLDAELAQLPEQWRLPLILCYLEGRTQNEAAGQLRCSEKTLRRRLEQARAALRRRLQRRGVVWPAALSAVLLSDSIAPAALKRGLVDSLVEAGRHVAARQMPTAIVSAKVAALAEGVVKAMFIAKLKMLAAVLLLALTGLGATVLLAQGGGLPSPQETPPLEAAMPGVILTTLKRVPDGRKEKKPEQPIATIEGVVEGKKVRPGPKLVEPGAQAAIKLLAASNVCTFYGSPQNRPFDQGDWQREVVAGIQKMRPHLHVQFGKPRQIEGMLYGPGEKVKCRVSEVVFFFFEPDQDGRVENRPICLWARDGDRYYFANQIAGHEELLQWLRQAHAR